MSRVTDDPNDPDLTHGADTEPGPQAEVYLVLPEEELAKGYIRPVRTNYIHTVCGVETRMSWKIAETYARDPKFYGSTYCVRCRKHLPVGEFVWVDGGGTVGS